LRVEGLSVAFDHPLGKVQAVDDVSFALMPAERLGLAGESGSGKSTLALSILRLIKPPGHIEAGAVWLDDARIADLDDDDIRQLRLAGIALVPQGSMNSLNPVLRIGGQIADAFADHGLRLGYREEQRRIAALLAAVGLPASVARMYPHELSGGMKQRVALARALAPNPRVLLMDEPFAALDALTREQLYGDIQEIWEKRRKTIIFVTHNVREAVCLGDRVLLFSPHPGRIRYDFTINLPRRRDINSVGVAESATEIRDKLQLLMEKQVEVTA
jgi:ABC-type glutathione transport system ATPase component